ncbi:MAG: hypothetical protein QOJ62_2247 [Actinomycetota bacterium]|jgi:hypothetical protein|nr:hypothetical protein [Actinomycetota bacterium]
MTLETKAPEAGGSRPPVRSVRRADISAKTLRTDRWWIQPLVTFGVLSSFIVYATWAAFIDRDYFWEPYVSPFYSPCLATKCGTVPGSSGVPHIGIFGQWFFTSPAIIILIVPLGFRMTCYYYRKAYYRSFWLSPPACAVAEPHRKYTGETRFPLIVQNFHRYFFYLGILLNIILTYDAVIAFRNHNGAWGHAGVGTLVLLLNAVFLWAYTASCHSCRSIVGGRLNHFSKHPIRYWLWSQVTRFNRYHMQIAWVSLVWVAWSDVYVRLVASGTITDLRFF